MELIEINAIDLELADGAQISTSVSGDGDAGDVFLDIAETIQVRGNDSITGEATQQHRERSDRKMA